MTLADRIRGIDTIRKWICVPILIGAMLLVGRYIYVIFLHETDLYEYTVRYEILILLYLIGYLLGSFLYLSRMKMGGAALVIFGSFGLTIGSVIDMLSIHTYILPVYFLYLIINIILSVLFIERLPRRFSISIFGISSIINLVGYFVFNCSMIIL